MDKLQRHYTKSEISQTYSTYMQYSELLNSQRNKVEQWLPDTRVAGDEDLLFNRQRFSVWDDENVLDMDSGDGCTTI